jgi:orotate phosphoribosyltransferase
MNMTREELATNVYSTSYLTGSFRLRSGKISSEYFDKYQFETRPHLLKAVAEFIQPLLPEEFELFAGLEIGGIPIATALSLLTGIPAVYVRKRPKEYGTMKLAEGMDIKGRTLLVVEDVITSGGQVLTSVEDLRARGAVVNHAVCVIDRQTGGKESLKNNGVELIPLFTMDELKAHK